MDEQQNYYKLATKKGLRYVTQDGNRISIEEMHKIPTINKEGRLSLTTMATDLKAKVAAQKGETDAFGSLSVSKSLSDEEILYTIVCDIKADRDAAENVKLKEQQIKKELELLNQLEEGDKVKKLEAMTPKEREEYKKSLLNLV